MVQCADGKGCASNRCTGQLVCAFHASTASDRQKRARQSRASLAAATKSVVGGGGRTWKKKMIEDLTRSAATKAADDGEFPPPPPPKKLKRRFETLLRTDTLKSSTRTRGGGAKSVGSTATIAGSLRQVWVQDVRGIAYFFDDQRNVYDAEDVVNAVPNPRVVGKWNNLENEFHIIYESIV